MRQEADSVRASTILDGPGETGPGTADSRIVDDVRNALYASKIVAYAQGFDHLRAGSKEFGWDLDLGALATIWRGGCIIRAQFLDRIKDAYAESPHLANLMLAPFFQDALSSAQGAWRSVVKHAIDQGVPIPAFASSLAYYDGYRRARGPANLIQGLRDRQHQQPGRVRVDDSLADVILDGRVVRDPQAHVDVALAGGVPLGDVYRAERYSVPHRRGADQEPGVDGLVVGLRAVADGADELRRRDRGVVDVQRS